MSPSRSRIYPFNSRGFQHFSSDRGCTSSLATFHQIDILDQVLITSWSGMWGPRLPRGRLLWGSPVPVELYICEALIVLFLGSLFSPVVQAQLSSVIAGRFLALDIQFFESQLVDESEKVRAVGWGFLGASFIFFIPPSCHHSSRLSSTPPPPFFSVLTAMSISKFHHQVSLRWRCFLRGKWPQHLSHACGRFYKGAHNQSESFFCLRWRWSGDWVAI